MLLYYKALPIRPDAQIPCNVQKAVRLNESDNQKAHLAIHQAVSLPILQNLSLYVVPPHPLLQVNDD